MNLGYDGSHRQNTAEKYDSELNQWINIAPMNVQRSDASACELNGKIYITGGGLIWNLLKLV